MNMRLTALAMAACLALVAGCGGDDDSTTADAESEAPATIAEIEVETGPFETEEEFVDAVNGFCDTAGEIYSRAPVWGVSAPGLEAEFTRLVELELQDVEQTEAIEAPEELAEEWAAYNEASAELTAAHEDVLAAAAGGDGDEANSILGGPSTEAADELTATAEAAGVECSSAEDPLSEVEPAAATDAAADAPQPTNTIDEAAEDWLAAFQSGNCKTIVEAVHSQLNVDEDAIADPDGTCKSRGDATSEWEVAGAVGWGPVGMAAMEVGPGQFAYEHFVIDPDKSDELRQVGETSADQNGLDPANEGIDADETISSLVDAIRADDTEAFNDALTIEALAAEEGGFVQEGDTITSIGDDPAFGEQIVTDIKADEAATPELLGVNQIEAVYLLETEGEYDYLLVAKHEPGSETEYGFTAYWALPGSGE
jgi:hypothetical protein